MQMYPLDQALRALDALRAAAGLGPDMLPLPAFVSMISDEVEQLRAQGRTDQQIADLIQQNSSIRITGRQITESYAPPELRRHG